MAVEETEEETKELVQPEASKLAQLLYVSATTT